MIQSVVKPKKGLTILVLCILFITSVYADCTVLTPDQYFTFDNADLTGTMLYDATGNDRNGTNSGATTGQVGMLNEAFACDGASDFVGLNHNSSGTIDGAFSISYGIKVDTADSGKTFYGGYGGNNNDYFMQGDQIGGIGDYVFGFGGEGSTTRTFIFSDNITWRDGNWHHMVIAKPDNVAANIVFYIDGEPMTNMGVYASDTYSGYVYNYQAYICGYNNQGSNDNPLDMWIDEYGMYDEYLTQTNVTDLYNGGALCNPTISGDVASITLNTDIIDGDNISLSNYPGGNYTFTANGTIAFTDNLFNVTLLNNGTLNLTYSNLNLSVNNLLKFFYSGEQAINLTVCAANNNASDCNSYNLYFDAINVNLTLTDSFVNNTIYYSPRDTVTFNATCSDTNLFYCGIAIFDDDTDALLYQENVSDINTTTYTFNFSKLSTFFADSTHLRIVHNGTDSHTDGDLIDLPWYFEDNNLIAEGDIYWKGDFKELDGNGLPATYFYLDPDVPDRFKLKMTFDQTALSHTLVIGSQSKSLIYREDDGYKGHFVYLPALRWIDHEGKNIRSVQVYPLGNGEYRLIITHDTPTDEVEFESVGNLNYLEKTYLFNVYKSTNIPIAHTDHSESIFDSATYVNVSTQQFNVTQATEVGIFASFTISKFSLPQETTVTGRLLIDGVEILEEDLRTVSSTNSVGSVTFSPVTYSATGSHIFTIQMKESGSGAVNVSNINTFIVAGYNNYAGDLENSYVNTSGSTAATEYTIVDTHTKALRNASSLFMLSGFTLTGTTAATVSGFVNNSGKSTTFTRYLTGSSSVGSTGALGMMTSIVTNHTMNTYINTTSGTATINGTMFMMRLMDDQNKTLYGQFKTNATTNGQPISVTSGDHLVTIEHVVVNETVIAGVSTVSMSLDAIGTAVVSVYKDEVLCEKHDRYFSSTDDIGTIQFYYFCEDVTGTENITLRVTSDQGIFIYDEGLVTFAGVDLTSTEFNSPPITTISTDLAATHSDLDNAIIRAYVTDPDDSVQNITVNWYIDGISVSSETTVGLVLQNYTFTLLKTNFAVGQTINATVRSHDGTVYGAYAYSTVSTVYAGTTPTGWNATAVSTLNGYIKDISEGINLLPYVFLYLAVMGIAFKFINRILIILSHSFGAMLGFLIVVSYGFSGTSVDYVKTGFGLILMIGSTVLFIKSWIFNRKFNEVDE